MPVSTNKTILFATATDGKAKHLWPIAVFNDPKGAKSYATFVKLAHNTGDADAIALLDPAHRKNAEGAPLKVERFSLVTVPYAPQPALAEFGDDEPAEPASS